MEVEALPVELTPSVPKDTVYPGLSNTTSQAAATVVDNRAWVSVNGLAQGSTTDINYNPSNGLSHVILTATLPAATGTLWTSIGMSQGWLYSMIERVSIRIAGSQVMTYSGQQLLIDNLTDADSTGKQGALVALGGQQLGAGSTDFAAGKAGLSASVYIKCPWNSCSSFQAALPFGTDLLTSPITISISWAQFQNVAYPAGGSWTSALLANLPTAMASASMNFRQTTLVRSEALLASRHNMNEESILYPLRYLATPQFRSPVITVSDNSVQSLALTGIRGGSLLYADVWITQANVSGNPLAFVQPLSLRVLLNGNVYYDSGIGSAASPYNNQLLSLCSRRNPTNVNVTTLNTAAGAVANSLTAAGAIAWTVVPFAQVSEPGCFETEGRSGLAVSNVTLTCEVAFAAVGSYYVNVAWHHAGSIMVTRGSASFVM